MSFLFAYIAHYSIIASRDTVGKLVSDFVVYFLCDLLSTHPLAFILDLGLLNTIVPSFFIRMKYTPIYGAVVLVIHVAGLIVGVLPVSRYMSCSFQLAWVLGFSYVDV